jgi:Tol biopolymer transport system component
MTNFHPNTTIMKGARMSDREHTAKTPSHRTGFFATLSNLLHGPGTSAPSRLRALLAVLALAIAAFAVTAAPASAAPPSPTTPVITEVSYASAHVTGEITADNGLLVFYSFQYSTDQTNWTTGPSGSFTATAAADKVEGKLSVPKGSTEYFVRLNANYFFQLEVSSPLPNPSFTTLPVDPASVLATANATEVEYTTAKASGEIERPANPDPAFDANCRFEYVIDAKFDINGYAEAAPPVPCGIDSLTAPNAKKHVEVPLEGLAPATEYHLRLTATNAGPDASLEAASTFTTLAVAPPSVVSIENAGEVEYTQAQVKGVVERPANADPAFDVECNFEYVTDEQFTTNEGNGDPGFTGATPVACNPNPVTAADTAPGTTKAVSATLGGLAASTSYHLRLSASNQGGSDAKEAAATFTTLGPVPKPTVISIDDAGGVTIHEAQVKGEIERPAGADPALDVNCRFEYITDKQFNENPPGEEFAGASPAYCAEPITSPDPGHPAVTAPVSAELGELIPGTTYHLRLLAENNAGGVDTKEAAHTFTTFEAEKPVVTIDPVGGGTYTTAHVSGTVDIDDPGHNLAYVNIEMSTDGVSWPSFAGERAVQEPGPHVVERDFTGLQPNTTYFFRINATYSSNLNSAEANGEVGFSAVETITTEPLFAPTAEDLAVTAITGTSAHFSGTVNPHAPAGELSALGKQAFATKWHFECTPECKDAKGNVIGGTVQGEEGAQPVAGDAIGLEPNRHYEEVKLIAKNGGELEATAGPVEFDTPLIKPTVKSAAGVSDGEGGYILEGSVNPNNSPVTKCEFKWGPDSNYVFKADCSPAKVGTDEVQSIKVNATGGEFRLSFQGDTTGDISFRAPASTMASELEALPSIGPSGVGVVGGPGDRDGSTPYIVTFGGPFGATNVPQMQSEDGTVPLGNPDGVPPGAGVSTRVEGSIAKPVTVEAHLTGLTPGAVYHADLVATNEAGTEDSKDFEFIPTLAPTQPPCPNEALREENNSLALPECRAYEKVTPDGKEGFPAELDDYAADTVLFNTYAANLAGSGSARSNIEPSLYVTVRTATGWETIPNLNGPNGSMLSPPDNAIFLEDTTYPNYSADFRSSLWLFLRQGEPSDREIWLRHPDGSLASVGRGCIEACIPGGANPLVGASDDLSHIVYSGFSIWGPGVHEFVGTGNDEPRRVDLDNSGTPISTCKRSGNDGATAGGRNAVSADGRVIFFTATGATGAASCTGTGSPPADEVWARIGGGLSVDASASQCHRTAPADPCNAPSNATFLGAAADGSRVFFTTKQQLLDGDIDETSDIYECDIPSGTPTPIGEANPCDALREVSGAATGADVESAFSISEDGSTAYFTAKGVLVSNKDALGNTAQAGDRNLYAWRTDAAHPDGQTRFVASLIDSGMANREVPQTTPDGRYLVFLTATPLLPTDTDEAIDLYRYDAESGLLSRASTRLTGVGGNGDFDVQIHIPPPTQVREDHHANTAISDDGQKVVFSTPEPLSPVDGNDANDVYLWTPAGVSLITTGSVEGGEAENGDFRLNGSGTAAISSSGRDIFFGTAGKLVASDGDQSGDVYDARVDGGFTNPPPGCTDEGCKAPPSDQPITPTPATSQPPADPGNVKPCPKGKIAKGNKCVKKSHGKHHKKKGKGHSKKASHKQGGGK